VVAGSIFTFSLTLGDFITPLLIGGTNSNLIFLFIPIATIVIFAFDRSNIQSWPIRHYTLHWFSVAWHGPEVRSALWLSIRAGLAATVLALTRIVGRDRRRAARVCTLVR
jgi:ABC-type spermidine/putrescine transport system permease subunit II